MRGSKVWPDYKHEAPRGALLGSSASSLSGSLCEFRTPAGQPQESGNTRIGTNRHAIPGVAGQVGHAICQRFSGWRSNRSVKNSVAT